MDAVRPGVASPYTFVWLSEVTVTTALPTV